MENWENCEQRFTVLRECPLPLGRVEEWRLKLKLLKRNRQLRLFCETATRHDFYALGRRRRNFLPSPSISLFLALLFFVLTTDST